MQPRRCDGGSSSDDVRKQLADGIGSIAGSVLEELDRDGRAQLVETAVRAAYGLRPTSAGLSQIRRLALPESQSGLHELFVHATLKHTSAEERATAAEGTDAAGDDPSALYALLSTEAPASLRVRAWPLLARLHDRYDRATLEQMSSDANVAPAAAAAAHAFTFVFASQYERAAAIAEPVLDEVARNDRHAALRLARALVHAGSR